VEERRRAPHYGEELRESADGKGGRGKLKLAVQLRRETTMTLKWIAGRHGDRSQPVQPVVETAPRRE
jgi:hypothetical protein